jgi:hypothetical protein
MIELAPAFFMLSSICMNDGWFSVCMESLSRRVCMWPVMQTMGAAAGMQHARMKKKRKAKRARKKSCSARTTNLLQDVVLQRLQVLARRHHHALVLTLLLRDCVERGRNAFAGMSEGGGMGQSTVSLMKEEHPPLLSSTTTSFYIHDGIHHDIRVFGKEKPAGWAKFPTKKLAAAAAAAAAFGPSQRCFCCCRLHPSTHEPPPQSIK